VLIYDTRCTRSRWLATFFFFHIERHVASVDVASMWILSATSKNLQKSESKSAADAGAVEQLIASISPQ
jgi:hypothetical protein